eukprot:gene1938-16446_t
MAKEIDERVTSAWKRFGQYSTFLRDQRMPMCLKRKIMNTVILPSMTYGAETWSLTNRQREKLAVTQRSMERSMLGVTRRDKIRNEDLRSRTGFSIFPVAVILAWIILGSTIQNLFSTKWPRVENIMAGKDASFPGLWKENHEGNGVLGQDLFSKLLMVQRILFRFGITKKIRVVPGRLDAVNRPHMSNTQPVYLVGTEHNDCQPFQASQIQTPKGEIWIDSSERKSYTLDFKWKTIELLDQMTQNQMKNKWQKVLNFMGIPNKCLVVKWNKKRLKIKDEINTNKLKNGKGNIVPARQRRKITSDNIDQREEFPLAAKSLRKSLKTSRQRNTNARNDKKWGHWFPENRSNVDQVSLPFIVNQGKTYDGKSTKQIRRQDKVQPIDAGIGRMFKKKIENEMDKWLDDEENIEKWYEKISARQRHVQAETKWAGEAWEELLEYGDIFQKSFERT